MVCASVHERAWAAKSSPGGRSAAESLLAVAEVGVVGRDFAEYDAAAGDLRKLLLRKSGNGLAVGEAAVATEELDSTAALPEEEKRRRRGTAEAYSREWWWNGTSNRATLEPRAATGARVASLPHKNMALLVYVRASSCIRETVYIGSNDRADVRRPGLLRNQVGLNSKPGQKGKIFFAWAVWLW